MNLLHMWGIAAVDGRFLRYTAFPHQNRLRITFCGKPFEDSTAVPEAAATAAPATGTTGTATAPTSGPAIGPAPGEALGSVIDLHTETPGLRISAPLHVEWAAANLDRIVSEAVRIWAATESDRIASEDARAAEPPTATEPDRPAAADRRIPDHRSLGTRRPAPTYRDCEG